MKKKMTTVEMNGFIKTNWKKMTDLELSKKLGITRNAVSKRRQGMDLIRDPEKKVYSIPEQVKLDREKQSKKTDEQASKKKVDFLLNENERLQKELEASMQIAEGIDPPEFELKSSKNDSEATAVVIASDFHIEETVRPETVNGLNKFTIPIAEKRVEQFFQNTLKLVKKEQSATIIDTLVLALLGDFISGNIHDELLENCSLRPIDAIIKAENLLIAGIEHLLENSELKLIIPCHVGNHTRITKKIHISTEQGNSLETIMYHHMQNYFRDNPRVTFLISDGYLSYLKIYDYTICFHHGHAIKFGGGIGGITIPTRKAISQWEKMKHADLHCFGHLHQFMDGGNFICNGSLIGYNTFAVMMKCDYEKPRQAFFLIDKKRGTKTVVCPILFDC